MWYWGQKGPGFSHEGYKEIRYKNCKRNSEFLWNKVTDERTRSEHSSRDRATGPWRGSSALFYLIVMQMMFSTKIANLLARCHPVHKADVDKAAFFSHFCSNKLTSSAEHFNLIISRGRGMVFNNHRASCREASPPFAPVLQPLGQMRLCTSRNRCLLTGISAVS